VGGELEGKSNNAFEILKAANTTEKQRSGDDDRKNNVRSITINPPHFHIKNPRHTLNDAPNVALCLGGVTSPQHQKIGNNTNMGDTNSLAESLHINSAAPIERRRRSFLSSPQTPAGKTGKVDTVISFSIIQTLNDDIDCPVGLALNKFDSDVEFFDKYLCVPGVRRFQMNQSDVTKKKKLEKITKSSVAGLSLSSSKQQHAHNSEIIYKARGKYQDVSVNLGSHHKSSASAGAAVDIANMLFWGQQNERPLYVLSQIEIEKALQASGVNDLKATSDRFRHRFTEDQKEYFEYCVSHAHSSIGGKDDELAAWLASIDKLAFKKKKKTNHKRKKIEQKQANAKKNRSQVDENYVLYEVDNDGLFSWRKLREEEINPSFFDQPNSM